MADAAWNDRGRLSRIGLAGVLRGTRGRRRNCVAAGAFWAGAVVWLWRLPV